MLTQVNPYAPPIARVADVDSVDCAAEAIRREHIKHEASIRSVGLLYLIGGVIGTTFAVGMIASGLMELERSGFLLGLGAVYLIFALPSFFVGRGLRNLRPWARVTSIVFSCIGLLGFPVGTVINGYILYLMLAAQGRRIFEPDYAAIVAATPDIKYRTSVVVWLVVGLLLLGILAAILVPTVMRR